MSRCFVQNNWDGTYTAVYQDDAGNYHVIPGGDRVGQPQAESALNAYGPCRAPSQPQPQPGGDGCGLPSAYGYGTSFDEHYKYCPGIGLVPLQVITDPSTIVGWQGGGPSGSSTCPSGDCGTPTDTPGSSPTGPVSEGAESQAGNFLLLAVVAFLFLMR